MVVQCAVMLSQDSFYRGLTQEELANVGDYDFDSPGALDTQAMVQCLEDLKAMKAVEVPIYDFTTHQRSGQEHFSDAPFLGWVGGGRGTGRGQRVVALTILQNLKFFRQLEEDLLPPSRLLRRAWPPYLPLYCEANSGCRAGGTPPPPPLTPTPKLFITISLKRCERENGIGRPPCRLDKKQNVHFRGISKCGTLQVRHSMWSRRMW